MNRQTSLTKTSVLAKKVGWSFRGSQVDVLTDIYKKETNIVIWQRKLTSMLNQAAKKILDINPALKISLVVTPQDECLSLKKALGHTDAATLLSKDILKLVEMFCCLFGLKQAGLRLIALDTAMCPNFHVDRVPCRLITTYQGIATEWIPHLAADRSKLGLENQRDSNDTSGLVNCKTNIQKLKKGDVALLKGEAWEGNQGAGLIHRSPQLLSEKYRLMLTLDFLNN